MLLLTKTNIKQHCRTCLKPLNDSTESSISGFNPDEVQDSKDLHFNICNDPELQQLISINIDGPCTSDMLTPVAHDFPENICLACYNKLYNFAFFRRMAQQSAEKLRTVLNSSGDIKMEVNLEHYEIEPKKDEFQLHDATAESEETFFEAAVANLTDAEMNEDTADPFSPSAPSISDGSDYEVEEKEKRKLRKMRCSKERKVIRKPKCTKEIKKDKYRCPQCNLNFAKNSELTDHVNKEHALGTTPFLCDYCTCSYRSLRNLKEHVVQRHQDKIKEQEHFQCTECPKAYLDKGALKTHMGLHFTDKKTRVCGICKEGFPVKKWLVEHLRTHTPDGRIPCAQCDKTYRRYEDLENHERSAHLKEKPHHCKICDKSFQNKQSFRIHNYRHTGKKPYLCDICGKDFRQRTAMTTHRSSHLKNDLKKQKME